MAERKTNLGTRSLHGRRMLIAPVQAVNEDNIVQVLSVVLPLHEQNIADCEYLEKYEKGEQPILLRIKEVRPEINEQIVVNYAHNIVDFKVGFDFGDPFAYVQRDLAHGEQRDEAKDRLIERMNEMFFSEGKLPLDQALAETFKIDGIAFRGAMPNIYRDNESGFKLMNLDPKNTFVVYSPDVYHRPILAGTHYSVPDIDNAAVKTYLRCYTSTTVFDLQCEGLIGSTAQLMGTSPNRIGVIPIVEYKNDYQRMGCFERVLDLMDALNAVQSDRANGLEQFVQSFIWFNNVDVDDQAFTELKEKGAIATSSRDGLNASVQYISAPLSQSDSQQLVDDLYDSILRVTAVPGREQATGGNTGQAIMLGGGGWQLAEEAATKASVIFQESEREMLKVVIAILRQKFKEFEGLSAGDIEIKPGRNKVSNLLTKTQGLMNMLSAGIHPLVAITNSDLFADPQQVYENSREYLEKWKPNSEEPEPQVDVMSVEEPGSAIEPDKADSI